MVASVEVGWAVYCGITINQQIVCGMLNDCLRVFDNSLKLIKEVELKSIPNKLLLLEDYEHLLCGESFGNIEIVNVLEWQVVQSFKLSSGNHIFDIAKLETANQYALGLYDDGGVQTVEIRRTDNSFQFTELT